MDKLALLGGTPVIPKGEGSFSWPRITPSLEKRVVEQLHESISIYDKSGVFEKFESAFARYHNKNFALLTNSGTTALHSLYVGAGLQPGDEVLCPAYTFFATVTPLLFTGAVPVLCDVDENGNIDPDEIRTRITPRTKGVMVTHMWGVPAQMRAIIEICKEHNLLLFEDCSHAHGARYDGRLVGSESDLAAWSLQGSKTVTGGEGGILTTSNNEFFYRALMLGHYNKRSKQEIPASHPLREFVVTGMGLKYRAHPLAVAIADELFLNLDTLLEQRRVYAAKIITALSGVPGLIPPNLAGVEPSFYALTFQYDQEALGGLPLERFLQALHAEGLSEMDHPGSTMPLNVLPLFQKPERLFPNYATTPFSYTPEDFPQAAQYFKRALKMPVWGYPDEEPMVDAYIRGILKVLNGYTHLL